jgi:hypothetical protein
VTAGHSLIRSNTRIQPAFIGGLVMGVLSALPIIAAGNLCCCLWVVSGGVVAAYVFQQNHPAPMTPGDGALVGLLAGVIGAVVYLLLSIPITLMVSPMERMVMQRIVESGSLPPDFRDYMGGYIGGGIGLTIGFILMLAAGSIFSTLGGLLGTAIFRKPPLPPGTIDVTPGA